MKNYVVYKHTSPSGQAYIGITNNYRKRCLEHQKLYNECFAFRNAIQKYGWDNFSHQILKENITLDEANYLECFLISEHKTMSPNGYNLTTGGKVFKMSEDSNKRKSFSRMGLFVGEKSPLFGMVGEKNHQSKSYKITAPSGEAVIIKGLFKFCRDNNLNDGAMSGVANGRVDSHHGYSCEHVDNDAKEAGSKRRSSRLKSNLTCRSGVKRTYVVTSPDGNSSVITGMAEFCRKNNLIASCMTNVARGAVDTHKGWSCEYIDPDKVKNKIASIEKRKIKMKELYDRKKKSYKAISPNGDTFIIKGMSGFCRENNLDQSKMSDVANGKRNHHKGWKCEHHTESDKDI